ncbi:hypothetical protein ABPG72_006226 [Tetrahymena utriculariae]
MIQSLQQQINSLNINYIINRNASAQYGVINNQANTLQQVRAQIQDSNFFIGQVFQFLDWQVFNGCIIGWQNEDSYSRVVQRLQLQKEGVANQVFTILYKYQATIQENSIQSFFQIQGQFSSCVILDDIGSLQSNDNVNYQIDLYVICDTSLNQYQINYSLDQQTNKINSSQVSSPNIYAMTTQVGWSVLSYKRIMSANGQLILYSNQNIGNIYLVVLNSQNQQASIEQLIEFYSQVSINLLYQYSLQLTIYPTGLIQTLLRSTKAQAAYNIAALLQQYNFIISENDQISQVEQYEDTKFRISFQNSFVYDITFQLNTLGQFVISSAAQYYYQDAFTSYISGFRGTQYTLLFGFTNFTTLQKMALFSNKVQQQNIYLIQSTSQVYDEQYTFPSSVVEINPDQIQINYINGQFISLNIEDKLGIIMDQSQNSLPLSAKTSIQPKGSNNPDNSITFLLTGGNNQSTALKLLFGLINIKNIIIFLL